MIHSIIFIVLSLSLTNAYGAHSKTIILDPAGDSHAPGRKLDDSFEHGLTMQCAQNLQKKIKERFPSVRVLLSRTPGESVDYLQHAHFANRLQVDCFIHMSFFQTKNSQHSLHIYRYVLNSTDDWHHQNLSQLNLIPVHEAHKLSVTESKRASSLIYNHIAHNPEVHWLTTHQPLAIPYKPLMGIAVPACGIEIGIPTTSSWKTMIPYLADALCSMILQLDDDTYEA